MDEPILKIHWERYTAHIDLDQATASTLLYPYTKEPIKQLSLLSEGCANTNYKVTFKNNTLPVVIRIYVREKSALNREIGIHKLVKDKIPVLQHLYTDDSCTAYPYPYSVLEWVDGRLMRDVILQEKEISECALDAGRYLSELRDIRFSQGGFFQENLLIRPFNPEEEYFPYVLMLLQDEIVKTSLGSDLLNEVINLVKANHHLLPEEKDASLTHADYDPANMLVKQEQGVWKISAILDWEFCFAGTYLLDIGMMLRYSHKLPPCFEKNFILGIEKFSEPLPLNWKKQAKLMDLLCLLQLAHYNPPSERPKMNSDVVSLIASTVTQWGSFKNDK